MHSQNSQTSKAKAISILKAELIKRGIYKPDAPKEEAREVCDALTTGGMEWVTRNFPGQVTCPYGERHRWFWNRIDELTPGKRCKPIAAVWPRGSGKSTTAELACVYVGKKLSRRFVLYVCDTQDQADKHLANIAARFEELGIGRMLTVHGQSKGWTKSLLRTSNGFNVMGVGLNASTRGIKIDQYRPDLIIFDDIDSEDDSKLTVQKKIRKLTSSIIPAGSTDCTVVYVQNLIHENSIMSMLVDGRADFLHDIEVDGPHVAVKGLQVERVVDGQGKRVYKIVEGEATWEGQSLSVCEWQINQYGYQTFLREAQQEVKGTGGVFFHVDRIRIIDSLDDLKATPDAPTPRIRKIVVGNDFAATEGAGDYTASAPIGITDDGAIVMFDLLHEQWGSDKVRKALATLYDQWRALGSFTILIPQDPGQSGKDQAEQMQTRWASEGYDTKIIPTSGKKSIRSRTAQEKINGGDFYLIRGSWNAEVLDEGRLYREDESHDHDDIFDAIADCVNDLVNCGWATSAAGIEEMARILTGKAG